MTEIRTNHWTDNSIQNAAMRNNAERAQVAEIAEALMFLLHGKTASAGAAGVMGGFELSTVTGQMQVSVAPGWGWYYDTGIAAPASPFAAFKLDAAEVVNVGAADGANARYDLISIACVSETDTELSVPFWQAAPQNINTQRGSQPTLTVTAGTPGAFPSIPATPSGHLALGAVRVGAGVTNLNSATLIDLRDMVSLATRASTRPVRFRSIPNSSVVDAAEFILAEVLASGVADGSGSKLKWDRTHDWPVARRTIATAGEDSGNDLFPMMIPGGRTWWRTLPWAGRDFIIGSITAIHGFVYLTVQRSGSATTFQQVVPIPSDSRGLEVVGCKVRYRTETAFDGVVGDRYVKLFKVGVDGTQSEIATENLTVGSAHGADVEVLPLTMSSTPVLAEGEQLFAVVSITASSGSGTGQVRLYSVSVQFREGRTS